METSSQMTYQQSQAEGLKSIPNPFPDLLILYYSSAGKILCSQTSPGNLKGDCFCLSFTVKFQRQVVCTFYLHPFSTVLSLTPQIIPNLANLLKLHF